MDEYQAEYFVIWTQDRSKAFGMSSLSRLDRFMVEYPYQDDPNTDRKFIAVAGQESHVLQEGMRYWGSNVSLVCVLRIKTSNSKHLLRALKKIYGPADSTKAPRITISGQEMTIYRGTSFDEVESVATMLGEKLTNHDNAFQNYYDSIYAVVNTREIDSEHERKHRAFEREDRVLWRKVKSLGLGDSKGGTFLSFLKKIMTVVYVCLILYFVFLRPGTPEKNQQF